MIRIFENRQDNCYECWNDNGKMSFFYEKKDAQNICIKRTVFTKGFEQSDSFRTIIGTIIDLLQAMKLKLTTECPWVHAYLEVYASKPLETP